MSVRAEQVERSRRAPPGLPAALRAVATGVALIAVALAFLLRAAHPLAHGAETSLVIAPPTAAAAACATTSAPAEALEHPGDCPLCVPASRAPTSTPPLVGVAVVLAESAAAPRPERASRPPSPLSDAHRSRAPPGAHGL